MVPKIGESEWYVMKALWESSPQSGNDIVRRVSARTDWSQSTILTMVRRLVKKQAIGVKKQNVMMYYPLIEENEIVRRETDLFVKRVYEGSVNMLIKGYIENGEMTQDEIDALRKMLEKTEQE